MSDLTLYHIEADLANLIDLREEMADKREDVTALDEQIAEYCQREVRKVDAIRSYLKHAEMMAEAALKEAATQKSRGQAWQARADRLKQFVQMVMEGMDWKPDQVRKLEGRSGSITLKANGGRQAVEVTDASLLPEEFVQYEGRISGKAWGNLQAVISDIQWDYWSGRADVQMGRVPMLGRIAAEMDKPCKSCAGRGRDTDSIEDATTQCADCDGSGKTSVAGARLEPRGNHVSVL